MISDRSKDGDNTFHIRSLVETSGNFVFYSIYLKLLFRIYYRFAGGKVKRSDGQQRQYILIFELETQTGTRVSHRQV